MFVGSECSAKHAAALGPAGRSFRCVLPMWGLRSSIREREAPIVGFCFSFPVRQTAVDAGTLLRWTKGFENPGAVGKDPAKLLAEAFQRKVAPDQAPAVRVAHVTLALMASLRELVPSKGQQSAPPGPSASQRRAVHLLKELCQLLNGVIRRGCTTEGRVSLQCLSLPS